MRVVIFIDWFTPAYKAGGPIQSIVNLVNQPIGDLEYKIICSNSDLDGGLLQGIYYDQWLRYNEHTEVWYNSKKKRVWSLLKSLNEWQPDIFFINGIYSFYYNFLPVVFGKAGKKIISARGMLHAGALSQKGKKKKLYLALWKVLKIHRKNSFHATNKQEESFIQAAFGGKTNIYLAENLPRILLASSAQAKTKEHLELISIGLISPMKNYYEVLKALKGCGAKVNYSIYGAVKDSAYWQQCEEAIKTLPPNIAVEYKGDLPSERVGEALAKAHVFILPSKSENFGHAIYEALTAGLPVITSHATPWNGLQAARAGMNVNPEIDYELSKAICFFAAFDNLEYAKWSESAQAYARKAIDIDGIQNQYRQMFQV